MTGTLDACPTRFALWPALQAAPTNDRRERSLPKGPSPMWKRIVFIALVIGVFVGIGFVALMVVLSVMSWQPPGNLGVKDGKLAYCPETPNVVSLPAAGVRHPGTTARLHNARP